MAAPIVRRAFLSALAAPLAPQASAYIPRLERALTENCIGFWYPRCLDRANGGYTINYNAIGEPNGRTSKGIVTQSRMVWLFARLARAGMTGKLTREQALDAAVHGFRFLREKMLDSKSGGFFWEVDAAGKPLRTQKHLYGQAFALYAMSELSLASQRKEALDAARELFQLLEAKSHDTDHGGYLESFEADWSATPSGTQSPMGDPTHKLMNTHLHLMEAMTTFYQASKLPLARERLLELISIESNTVVRKTLAACTDKYTRDWKPLREGDFRRVSYGHDLENIWLLMDATKAAGLPAGPLQDLYRESFAYCHKYGYDTVNGGFYDSGFPNQPADRKTKVWWVQAEAIVTALRMFELTGEPVYRDVFRQTWDFIEREMIDWKAGEWHASVMPSGEKRGDKAQIWKAGYHNGRALVECLESVRRLKSL